MNTLNIKKFLKDLKENPYEYKKVLQFVKDNTPQNGKILDVGCGYGRYLKPLSKEFKNIVGVEANKLIRDTLIQKGLKVVSPEKLDRKERFDTIIMSHIIEHFHPEELIEMMDRYLDLLKVGGCIIIATPTLTETFYMDLDHKRPYYPQSIEEVFDGNNQQIKSYSKNRLRTEKIHFRKSRFQLFKNSLLFNNTKNLGIAINILLALIFRISFGLIGYKSGWIGIFRKF
ncbi:MAG: class I SAM-dependent methyltransferase [Candidatus Dojkabacteria bacterium]